LVCYFITVDIPALFNETKFSSYQCDDYVPPPHRTPTLTRMSAVVRELLGQTQESDDSGNEAFVDALEEQPNFCESSSQDTRNHHHDDEDEDIDVDVDVSSISGPIAPIPTFAHPKLGRPR